MNKREFLAKLSKALSQLNREERKRQLDYYGEMIDDRIDEGMSEEEAVYRIGTVQGVAAKILSEASPEQMKKKRKIGVLGWIGIILGALILITAVLAAVFMFDVAEDNGNISDVEDMIDNRLELDEDDAFVMNYAVDGDNVSVDFDRSFVNESGNGSFAHYDHSLGRANCLNLNISVAGGDIRLLDD